MPAAAFYSQEIHGPFETFDIGDLDLEEGGRLRGGKLAYATFGRLNAAKDNAILMPTWFSGTTKHLEQIYIGPGRALDPERYFIISANQIGNGLSTSPHNTPEPFNGPRFPRIRIGDDVVAQHRLVTQKFGIERLAMVVSGSMGAQQTYDWAVRFPKMVARAAPIAGTAQNTPHDFLFTETLMDTITSDPAFHDGWYEDQSQVHVGLRRHARLWGVMGLCTEFYKQELWRAMGFTSMEDFMVGFVEGYFLPMDPNDLLCMAWKWQRGDVARHTGGNLAEALKRITALTYVMPLSTDMCFPVADCAAEQKLIPNSQLRAVNTNFGHFGLFGVEPDYHTQIDKNLKELLATKA